MLLVQIVVLALFGIGFGQIVMSLPFYRIVLYWLEQTWTRGKPLSCWTCLCFWGALAGSLPVWHSTWQDALAVVAATGLASTIMEKVKPMMPTNLPEIDFDAEPGVDSWEDLE
mgnify:CR=1 FL=1